MTILSSSGNSLKSMERRYQLCKIKQYTKTNISVAPEKSMFDSLNL